MALRSVTLGGKVFPITGINLGIIRGNFAAFRAVSEMEKDRLPTGDQLTGMIELLAAAATMADPAMTRDAFLAHVDAIDIGDAMPELAAAMKVLMAKTRAPVEEASPGESASSSSETSPVSTG
jgi:hypothetical protein